MTSEQDFLLVACAVIVGNLLTVIHVAGWRGYTRGRRTPSGAPVWSYFAILGSGIFVLGAAILFFRSIIVPML